MRRQKGLIVSALIASVVLPAPAGARARVRQACAIGPTVSALNQYCENIPSATGGSTPGPATRALAPALPALVVRQLEASAAGSAKRKLLQLPAAGPRLSLAGAGSPAGAGRPAASAATKTTGSSPWLLICALLGAVTLALLVAAAGRRRRRVAV